MSQRPLGQRHENYSQAIRPLFLWNRLRPKPWERTDGPLPQLPGHRSAKSKTTSLSEKKRQSPTGDCRFGTRLERYLVRCVVVGGWPFLGTVQEDHSFGSQFQARGRCAILGGIQIHANIATLNQDLAAFLEVLAVILGTDAEHRDSIPSRSLLTIAFLVDCD